MRPTPAALGVPARYAPPVTAPTRRPAARRRRPILSAWWRQFDDPLLTDLIGARDRRQPRRSPQSRGAAGPGARSRWSRRAAICCRRSTGSAGATRNFTHGGSLLDHRRRQQRHRRHGRHDRRQSSGSTQLSLGARRLVAGRHLRRPDPRRSRRRAPTRRRRCSISKACAPRSRARSPPIISTRAWPRRGSHRAQHAAHAGRQSPDRRLARAGGTGLVARRRAGARPARADRGDASRARDLLPPGGQPARRADRPGAGRAARRDGGGEADPARARRDRGRHPRRYAAPAPRRAQRRAPARRRHRADRRRQGALYSRRLSISGNIDTDAATFGKLGDLLTGGLFAGLTQTIFDGGRRARRCARRARAPTSPSPPTSRRC